jgi:hypothetical protein
MSSDDVDSVFFKYHLIKAESARLIVVPVNVALAEQHTSFTEQHTAELAEQHITCVLAEPDRISIIVSRDD